jgi:hypothetical protein
MYLKLKVYRGLYVIAGILIVVISPQLFAGHMGQRNPEVRRFLAT